MTRGGLYICVPKSVSLSSISTMEYSNTTYITISILTLLLLTKLLSFFKTNKNNNKKKYPPSPPSLPILGHLHLLSKPLHRSLSRLSSFHGPALLLRFGSRPVLAISSASLAHQCFTGDSDLAFANRPHLPSAEHRTYGYSAIGAANYGPHWRNLRRIATVEVLSSHRLNSFHNVRTSVVHEMVKGVFEESMKTGGGFVKVEMRKRLFELAMNNMMRMIAGRLEEEVVEVEKFRKTVEEMFAMAGASNVGDFLPGMWWMGVRRRRRLAKYMDGILQGLIDMVRREGGNEEKSMIGVLLSLQEEDREYYNDKNIKALIISMLSAGTDTSSNTIEWAMSLLLNSPDKLHKAQAEIERHTNNKNMLQESDLPNLPYLNHIVMETLRLYPAGPLLVPHESRIHCAVGGYDVDPGTMLLVNAYAIQRDPTVWDEPDKFSPERFEDAKVDEGKLFPFGIGRRRCPGEGLARRVVGLVLGSLIQCFEWERVGMEKVDMSEGSGLTMPRAVALEAMCKPREGMKEVLSTL